MIISIEVDDNLLENDPHKAYSQLCEELSDKLATAKAAMEETEDIVPFDEVQDIINRWKQYDYEKAQTL